MKYYFENKENRERLRIALIEWLGTPWRHWCGVKGLGTDCIHFVLRILEETGAVNTGLVVPEYPRDWHLHKTEEKLAHSIMNEMNVDILDIENLMNGDIVLFQFGRAASHASIYCDGYIWEALTNRKVEKSSITKQKMNRARYNFRVRNYE